MTRALLDKNQTEKIGGILNQLKFIHPPIEATTLQKNEEDKLFFVYILVGICHQINWNFLIDTLKSIREKYPQKFTPQYLAKISHQELKAWLRKYPQKRRLGKKFKRAKLVRDMCQVLLKEHQGKMTNLVKKSKGKMKGQGGIYALLAQTIAYGEDPLYKKTSVFIDVVDDWSLTSFSDWQNYIPPIDYQITRILIRSGVIKIIDEGLFQKLKNYSPVGTKEDLLIRQQAIEAINLIAGKAPKKRKVLQGVLWCLGRDCCHEKNPHCQSCSLKDCTCQLYLANPCPGNCYLKEVCYAFQKNPKYLKIREQNFLTTWY